jgi:hypothetical protein
MGGFERKSRRRKLTTYKKKKFPSELWRWGRLGKVKVDPKDKILGP